MEESMALALRMPKLTVVDLNPHISCILCGGYFIDATTITECLHSFCRACIVRYLESSKYCPVCEVQIHKTRPLRCIRSDKMLQDIVYKLVPGLYQNEMKRRRELYASQPPEAIKESRDEEDRGEGLERRYIFTPDEIFSIILQYKQSLSSSKDTDEKLEEEPENIVRRFIRCAAAVRISHLKKFIRIKFGIPSALEVVMCTKDELLEDDYTLTDVAYISRWKRDGPIHLNFSISKKPKQFTPLVPKSIPSPPKECRVDDVPGDVPTPNVNCSQKDSLPKKEFAVVGPEKRNKEKADQIKAKEDVKLKGKHQSNPKRIKVSKHTKTDTKSKTYKEKKKSRLMRAIKRLEPQKTKSSTSSNPIKDFNPKVVCQKIVVADSQKQKAESPTPPKVPKLTIPLTPKILEMAARHAEDDKIDMDSDLYEGRLVIVDVEGSSKESDDEGCNDIKDSPNPIILNKKDVDDYEVDSGRGSDSSSRAEARSIEDEVVDSPGSSTVLSPDLDKPDTFTLPSLTKTTTTPDETSKAMDVDLKSISNVPTPPNTPKDDCGVLDLSICNRKRVDGDVPLYKPRPVANPPVLDKFRQTTPCLPLPSHPSFKLFPPMIPPPSGIYKKPDCPRGGGGFRYNRASTLTVFNPDPKSNVTKLVIKNMDPKPDHRHHHHHHHHHNHHHQKV